MSRDTVLNKIVFGLLGLLLLVFVFIVPPLQKPDEEVHFYRTLSLASGHVFCPKPTGNILKLDGKFVQMIDQIHRTDLPLHKEKKFDLALYFQKTDNNYQTIKKYNVDYQCSYPTISYIPSVLGVGIASILTNNPVVIFFSGRLVMAIIAFIWMLVLYKKVHSSARPILLLLFFTPVFLQQVSAYSYDGVHLLLALTLFALVVQKSANLFAFFLTLLLFLLAKPGGYEAFVLLIFTIPVGSLAQTKKQYLMKISIFIAMLICAYALTKITLLSSYGSGAQLRADVIPQQNLAVALGNPLQVIRMTIWTVFTRGVFYLESTIGILGWLEYSIGLFGYLSYGLLCLYVLFGITPPKELLLSRSRFMVISTATLCVLGELFFLFYLLWSHPTDTSIGGIQGRYFLPILPFILLMIVTLRGFIFPKVRLVFKQKIFLALLFMLALSTIVAVFVRYY